MATSNVGNSINVLQFQQDLDAEIFGLLLDDALSPGIYRGLDLSILPTGDILVSSGSVMIKDKNAIAGTTKIVFQQAFSVTVSEQFPYILMEWEYKAQLGWYVDVFAAESKTEDYQIVVCKGVFTDGTLTGVDESERSVVYNVGDLSTEIYNKVSKTGNETVDGVKTFLLSPILPSAEPIEDNGAVSKIFVTNQLGDKVSKTDSETIDGIKSFSSIPILPGVDPINDDDAVRKAYADTKVSKNGDETIDDIKTFTSIPVLPASDPINDDDAVRKAYVDAQLNGTVTIDGAQEITGIKTFSSLPVLTSDPVSGADAVRKIYVDNLLDDKVSKSGDETIDDIKTFTSIPVLPIDDPIDENEATRKGYVDTKVSKTDNETVGGIKTFTSIPILPVDDPVDENEATRKAYVDTKVSRIDSETVGGIKTFTSIPVLPSTDPVNDNDAVRKRYVDSVITAALDTYKSSGKWRLKSVNDRKILISPENVVISAGGVKYSFNSEEFDISVSSNWVGDVIPTLNGKNSYIQCSNVDGSIKFSLNEVETDYTLIGGFHCLGTDAGDLFPYDSQYDDLSIMDQFIGGDFSTTLNVIEPPGATTSLVISGTNITGSGIGLLTIAVGDYVRIMGSNSNIGSYKVSSIAPNVIILAAPITAETVSSGRVYTCRHWLDGFENGDILPLSIWDLNHIPSASIIPKNMIYDPYRKIWVDIYLTGIDSNNNFNSMVQTNVNPEDAKLKLIKKSKQLPTYDDFLSYARGTPQEIDANDSTYTGVNSTSDIVSPRRVVSIFGVEDCCGVVKQIGGDLVVLGILKSPNFSVGEYNNRGETNYGLSYSLLGGALGEGVDCGTRYFNRINNLTIGTDVGFRGMTK